MRRLRARGGEAGYTLVELVAVLTILVTILTALTTLFVSGARAELDLNERFQAQQAARTALDRMRRELHCASAITPASGAWETTVTVTLPAHCPGAGGAGATVVYTTVAAGAGTWRLNRNGVGVAEHVTSASPFRYFPPTADSLGRLRVLLPVDVDPAAGSRAWALQDDIVLRNTTRA